MRLSALLRDVIEIAPGLDREVQDLSLDSKSIRPGAAFIALRGTQRHGIEFAAEAVARGATIVLAEAPLPDIVQLDAPVVVIGELRAHLGALARCFHADAAAALRLIGVTGTNGKTSSVQMIAQALSASGEPCGTIGTLGTGLHGRITAGERTTPDVLAVHAAIAAMRRDGARSIAMEVTSHALDQGRVDGLDFEIAVFTNLTRDHLDYHGSMDAYGATKARLFAWPSLRAAVINVDDAFGATLAGRIRADVRVIRTGCSRQDVDVHASEVHADASGLRFTLWIEAERLAVATRLIGRFNVANLLGVAGVLHARGWPAARIAQTLSQLDPVPGRMSRLGGDGRRPLVVVDYAHTPDALDKALSTLREHAAARLIVVFGCGGERDAGKRPQMAALAEQKADVVIVTDDNPRRENGDAIVADIRKGFVRPEAVRFERDRARAIALAIGMAAADDVVLIAGKGHEPYQEIDGTKYPFDDLQVAAELLKEAA
ncbi:MAG: UDP-N-acetylmuramoyl-L-alanyl-D-glutamate--2,6-diaminopimelate ligase [Xanthomonadales bacterium]|nr:UDP-N-acetylmuramoyl-L-alanyl-D-glutamate--2,6-diaminopimelate ligase [Xanthomonadales bacterium]